MKWLADGVLIKRLSNSMIPIMTVVALLGCLWWVSAWVWLVMSPPSFPKLEAVAPSTQTPSYERYHFFTTPTQTTTTIEGVSLLGTLPAQPNKNSRALLLIEGAPTMLTVGDKVGATEFVLSAVGMHEVKLSDGAGALATISMTTAPLSTEPPSSNESGLIDNQSLARYGVGTQPSAPTPQATPMQATEQPAQEQATAMATAPMVGETGTTETTTMLNDMGLLVSEGGYQVTSNAPPKFIEELGLMAGDKLISINGQPLGTNPAADARLLYGMGSNVQLQVMRGDQVVTIDTNFK
ncbi:MAG: hypothetical protein Q4C68_02875 [Moraxella sp.]|nr:hypothetical protein [Moraxella sp.]